MQADLMVERRSQGATFAAIGREIGCSAQAVKYHVKGGEQERRKAESKQRYDANKREILAQRAEYRENNREVLRARNRVASKRYRTQHPERRKQITQRYRDDNEERIMEYNKRYREENKDGVTAKAARYRARKRGACCGSTDGVVAVYKKARSEISVRCYLCGKLIPMGKRHVDHIMPLAKGGLHTASNLAVACARCNLKKQAKLPNEIGLLV